MKPESADDRPPGDRHETPSTSPGQATERLKTGIVYRSPEKYRVSPVRTWLRVQSAAFNAVSVPCLRKSRRPTQPRQAKTAIIKAQVPA